jgi:ketosteroid isomerase-like protein
MGAINDDRSVTVLGWAPRGPPPGGDLSSMRRRGRERRMGPFRGATGTSPGRVGRAARNPRQKELTMTAKSIRFVNGHLLASLVIALGLLAVPVFSLFDGASQTRAAEGDDPAEVVDAYAAAINGEDLDAILALYADDAIHILLPTPDGTAGICKGKEQFGMFYEQGVANHDRIAVEPGTVAVEGDRVTFAARLSSDAWTELGLGTLESRSEIVLADGKIASHVVMLEPAAARQLLTALGALAVPAGSH